MSAYDYMAEIQKHKQSDVMRYLLRIRCWEYRQRHSVHKTDRSTRPDKARKLGYTKKRGIVIYRVRIRRGGRRRQVKKGNVCGKPINQGIYQQKQKKSLQALAEIRVGRRLKSLRILNSYWVGQDATYKHYEVILVDPMVNNIRNDSRINWICSNKHRRRECRGLTTATKKSRGLGGNKTIGGSKRGCWRRNNTVSLLRYR
ncbi:large subunit ribosomal protein L15e [Nematocida ausubeli]|uniref:Ribosomal protein L15 n=1 Tax=Nematocida ausubeli (strain ATCC PRA-371 / ERTm2) TaxID=1913371 RepID=A0A086J2X0_NEMA1|nr:ribosomal L15 [Nematocida ausubeli]KAI5137239.1 large subunit ribosomal protein L15e [Nematocida ausubeli]KAI5149872.1 large subunit ribosomal protein L15e [Nematocida ausubeli]KAI5163082.1 large subunit ribosomal protein L15e [Nematocida ausubeli]KFG26488.1 ribosomal L15 [Nematocida ausubeli]